MRELFSAEQAPQSSVYWNRFDSVGFMQPSLNQQPPAQLTNNNAPAAFKQQAKKKPQIPSLKNLGALGFTDLKNDDDDDQNANKAAAEETKLTAVDNSKLAIKKGPPMGGLGINLASVKRDVDNDEPSQQSKPVPSMNLGVLS